MKIEATPIPAAFDRYSNQTDLIEASKDHPLKGYPLPEDRWHIPTTEWDEMAATGVITVPDGPWVVSDHPARIQAINEGRSLDPADPIEIHHPIKHAWRTQYDLVTDQGLPVHPKARLGVTTEIWSRKNDKEQQHKLGMATGIGREWHYGALHTGALLLARLSTEGEIEYPVTTELRGDRIRRSFLGGYTEKGESIADGCLRESNEEGHVIEGLDELGFSIKDLEELPHILWALSPAITGPCTLNAWLAEHFLAIDATSIPDMQNLQLENGEPNIIQDVTWRTAHELLEDKTFLGAHRRALRAHLHILATT